MSFGKGIGKYAITRDFSVSFPSTSMQKSGLSSSAEPLTDATLTVRVIKSFRYRTAKSLVLHHVDLTKTTVDELKEMSRQGVVNRFTIQSLLTASSSVILTELGWVPFRTMALGD